MKEAKLEVLLYDVLHEIEADLKMGPPRMDGDIDSKQMAKMWGCSEKTARERASRLANRKSGKWQWMKVQGNESYGSRNILVLRKNVSTPSHKSKRSPKANMEKIK